jgi:hypothetical protein
MSFGRFMWVLDRQQPDGLGLFEQHIRVELLAQTASK